ncbi:(2Fe-2S)-binding protein [Bermanella marisrubri]|uniref:Probable oxidoreductase n=1 Tax=Bermanella marisrubri TaxID=207949 RepID=Q1N659_9GAMM|nr:(2Fe-2S)-binding protein [Bermanella marisrubri]EAT13733.1 probable oxidoreductase [Oceanobacter sp. RED65] [Bermanella marisrubri]QIZ84509.1 (2Fe-2S)-binding protein [Bermanella marisrubri]
MITFSLNGQSIEVDAAPDTPLLWVVRDHLKMKGTKFGCGMGLCGACSMLIDGNSSRTCITPISSVAGKDVVTIEGIGDQQTLSILQEAWVEAGVPQCGYCQSGQIISATALLKQNPNPSDDDINNAMSGNICRCGTYPNIKKAIKQAASSLKQGKGQLQAVRIFDPQSNSQGVQA